jgi:hypothetical protein
MTIDADALKAYRARWDEVAEIERQEQKHKTVAQRLQRLDVLFQFALVSDIYKRAIAQKARDAEPVRQRWIRLKSHLS